MSTTISPPHPDSSPNDAVEAQLDELMPKPASRLTRWLIGMSLVIATLGFGVLVLLGMIVPSPTSDGSWSSGKVLDMAEDGSMATVRVGIPNWSQRDVRLTDITLPHDDVVLLDVVGRFDPPPEWDCSTTGWSADCVGTSASSGDNGPPSMSPLPMDLPSDGWLDLHITFAPADCSEPDALGDPTGLPESIDIADWKNVQVRINVIDVDDLDDIRTWGEVEARFDFGDGAFPPFSSTALLDDRLSDGQFPPFGSTESFIELIGDAEGNLLQTMCELQAK